MIQIGDRVLFILQWQIDIISSITDKIHPTSFYIDKTYPHFMWTGRYFVCNANDVKHSGCQNMSFDKMLDTIAESKLIRPMHTRPKYFVFNGTYLLPLTKENHAIPRT